LEQRLAARIAAEPAPPAGAASGEPSTGTISEEARPADLDAAVVSTPPTVEEEGFVWPEGALQAAAGSAASDGAGVPEARASEPEGPLPSLDQLIQKLPADTREVLDELFRARFVGVKRIQLSSLK
jgi:hypothetical protein